SFSRHQSGTIETGSNRLDRLSTRGYGAGTPRLLRTARAPSNASPGSGSSRSSKEETMSHQPPIETSTELPAWQRRFRAPVVLWTHAAPLRPERGVAVANLTGVHQLYAWDVATGNLRQLTDRPEGMLFGWISPDGRYVYYLDDALGNEIGHYVRVPFDGTRESAPEDVTPSLPLYASPGMVLSRSGYLLAFIAPDADGFHVYTVDLAPDGGPSAPRKLHTSQKLLLGLAVSYEGACVAFGSAERH